MSRKRRLESDVDEEYLEEYPELNTADKITLKEWEKVKDRMAETEPSVIKILQSDLLLDDKASLCELLNVYTNIPDFVSAEKLEIKKQITEEFKLAQNRYNQYQKYSKAEHACFEREMKELEQYVEMNDLKYNILRLNCSKSNKQNIYNEYNRYLQMDSRDDERGKLYTWLKWATALPYDSLKHFSQSNITATLKKVRERLNEELYGMESVKEQLLLFLHSKLRNPNLSKSSLGLIGPSGCGKTTIIRILSDVLEYPLEQISLGGIHSPDFLKGHPYTYIGAEPGEIVKKLCKMNVKNGILFLDEIDKVESSEVCSALLHITDHSQNHKFQDNYLSLLQIDLSKLWFIYSMNSRLKDRALDDRIYYISIPGYTKQDKRTIITNYLLKRVCVAMNWDKGSLSLSSEAIDYLIDSVAPDNPGIRPLEDAIYNVGRKVAFLLHNQNESELRCSFNTAKKIKLPYRICKEDIKLFLI